MQGYGNHIPELFRDSAVIMNASSEAFFWWITWDILTDQAGSEEIILNENIRNPILVSFTSKGLLPYHGLGSGIRRALSAWNDIDFIDDRDTNQFSAVIYRKADGMHMDSIGSSGNEHESPNIPGDSSGKSSGITATAGKILNLLRQDPHATIPQLAESLGVSTRAVEKNIRSLRLDGKLERVGSHRNGFWKVRG